MSVHTSSWEVGGMVFYLSKSNERLWKTRDKFSHIRMSHIKKYRILSIYYEKLTIVKMYTRKIRDMQKNIWKKVETFFNLNN